MEWSSLSENHEKKKKDKKSYAVVHSIGKGKAVNVTI